MPVLEMDKRLQHFRGHGHVWSNFTRIPGDVKQSYVFFCRTKCGFVGNYDIPRSKDWWFFLWGLIIIYHKFSTWTLVESPLAICPFLRMGMGISLSFVWCGFVRFTTLNKSEIVFYLCSHHFVIDCQRFLRANRCFHIPNAKHGAGICTPTFTRTIYHPVI